MRQVDILGNAATDDDGKFCRVSVNGVRIPPNVREKMAAAEKLYGMDKETFIRAAIYAWLERNSGVGVGAKEGAE